jgi:hypothetical protein
MQSQQIRGALPRIVMPVSSRYPQLLCILAHFRKIFKVMPGRKAPSAVFRHQEPGIHQSRSKMDRRIESGDDSSRSHHARRLGRVNDR